MLDMQKKETPELPDGWEWQGGERGGAYYTTWFGTKYRMGGPTAGWGRRLGGYSGSVFWDQGNKHSVSIRPIVGITADDDPRYDYPDISRQFDSEQDALDAVPKLIRELYQKAREAKRGGQ